MRKFKNYRIWQDSMELVKLIFKLANELPDNEKYGLRSQITRAAVSIPSNIAEGSGRNSDKEFKRFVEIAMTFKEKNRQGTLTLETLLQYRQRRRSWLHSLRTQSMSYNETNVNFG